MQKLIVSGCSWTAKVNDAGYWLQTLCEEHREVECI